MDDNPWCTTEWLSQPLWSQLLGTSQRFLQEWVLLFHHLGEHAACNQRILFCLLVIAWAVTAWQKWHLNCTKGHQLGAWMNVHRRQLMTPHGAAVLTPVSSSYNCAKLEPEFCLHSQLCFCRCQEAHGFCTAKKALKTLSFWSSGWFSSACSPGGAAFVNVQCHINQGEKPSPGAHHTICS